MEVEDKQAFHLEMVLVDKDLKEQDFEALMVEVVAEVLVVQLEVLVMEDLV